MGSSAPPTPKSLSTSMSKPSPKSTPNKIDEANPSVGSPSDFTKVHGKSLTEMSGKTSDDFDTSSPTFGTSFRKTVTKPLLFKGSSQKLSKNRVSVGSGVTIPFEYNQPSFATLDQVLLPFEKNRKDAKTRLLPRQSETYNVKLIGNLTERYARDVFHTVINYSWAKLLLLMVCLYLAGFALFGFIYYVGRHGLEVLIGEPRLLSYMECIYFSVQVFHAIGFGIAEPTDDFVNWVTLFHVIYAYIFNAVTIGIIFVRFSSGSLRAQTLLFSEHATVTPGDENHSPTLCVRVMNLRENQLLSVSFGMVLVQDKRRGKGHKVTPLKVQTPKFPLLSLPWIIKHKIDAESPLFNQSYDEYCDFGTEVIVYLEGVDETSGHVVQAKRSYIAEEIVFDGAFDVAVTVDETGQHTVKLDKFNGVNSSFSIKNVDLDAHTP